MQNFSAIRPVVRWPFWKKNHVEVASVLHGRWLNFQNVQYIMAKNALGDINVEPHLSEQLCPKAANRSTTYIFHNQAMQISERNISWITSTDTCIHRIALTVSSLAGLLAHQPTVNALLVEMHAHNARHPE